MNIVRNEIRTGVLVVLSIAILVTLLLYLGAPGVFTKQKTFYIYVDNASGLKQGADVALAGRRIGQVMRLTSPVPEAERPDPKKETKVEVKVAEKALIYNEVYVSVSQNGLLGETFIDFTSGSEKSGLAPDSKWFLGNKPAGIDQAVPLVLEKLDPLLNTANATLASLQQTAQSLTRLTAKDGEISTTLVEFRTVASNFTKLSGPEGPLKLTLDNLAQITGPNGKLQTTLSGVEALTGENGELNKTLRDAQQLLTNGDINRTLRNTREATANLNNTIDSLRGQFNTIAFNLEQATDTVKRQPWRLIWPSTKKYPETEGATATTAAPKATPKPAPTPRRKAGRRES